MSRSAGRCSVRLSFASSLAISTFLAACSQPSSYATVDLSGSLPDRVSEAYSPVTGAPVYQSTQVYTLSNPSAPSAPGYGGAQLAYSDAPPDQVAALQFDYDPSLLQRPEWDAQVGYAPQAYAPQAYAPQAYASQTYSAQGYPPPSYTDGIAIAQGPDARSYIDVGPMQPPPQIDAAPVYENVTGMPLARTDIELPAPRVEIAPQSVDPFTLPVGTEEFVDVETPLEFQAPQVTVQAPQPVIQEPVASPSYEAIAETTRLERAPRQPLAADPYYELPSVRPEVDPRKFLPRQPEQQVAPVDSDPGNAYRDVQPEPMTPKARNTRLSAPQVVRPREKFGVGPDAYPRPYEALRPGVYPPLPTDASASVQDPPEEIGVWADLANSARLDFAPAAPMSEGIAAEAVEAMQEIAPAEPMPEPLAALEEVAPVEPAPKAVEFVDMPVAASVDTFALDYTIREGDTLYSIARRYGIAPKVLAAANGMPLESTIYPGQSIGIPISAASPNDTLGDAPIVVLQTAEYVPQSELPVAQEPETLATIVAQESAPLALGWEETPVLDRGVAQRYGVIPEADRGRLSWPVHGQVYRLSRGQIEIAAAPGTPVTAAASGRVIHVEDGPLGVMVVIEHADGWRSVTLGLDATPVVPGQTVGEGMMLGAVGTIARIRLELRDRSHNIAEVLRAMKGSS